MGSQETLLLTVVVCVMVLLVVSVKSIGKVSAKEHYILDVQCEIAGQIKHYQVNQVRHKDGVVSFKVDEQRIECSHFFIQEVAQSHHK